MSTDTKPDVDAAIEQAWTNLYAKLDAIIPIKPKLHGEAQAVAIIKGLAHELKGAASALHGVAETLKMRPNLTHTQRLQLANSTMLASRRARQAAESVLG
jgi:hypothetical protein